MKVHLVSHTHDPIGTVLRIWDASKMTEPWEELPDHKPVWHDEREPRYGVVVGGHRDFSDEDIALFRAILAQEVPVMENVVFNFVIEDAPISWREQAVRHRVGVSYGDNFGVDIVPDYGTGETYWSQSMRLLDMSNFAFDGRYFTPGSISETYQRQATYQLVMEHIEEAYKNLIALGVPLEDARNVIPLAATSRIAMTINLRALRHIIGKRSCWILQSSLWGPVIRGMIDELTEKVHPIFRELVYPPCVEGGKFVGCKFVEENRRRETGEDAMPLCPLYVTSAMGVRVQLVRNLPKAEEIVERIPEYADLWNQPDLAETWEWSKK